MAKSMLDTSQGSAERDLPYLQWVVQAILSNSLLDIVIAKSMHVTPKVRRKEICYVKPVLKVLSVCSRDILKVVG